MRKLTYWLVGLLLIGVAVGAVLLLNNIREITWQAAENAVCEATVADQGGVDINSAFRFSFDDDVSANAVRRFLNVEPAVELNFHRGLQAREVLAVPLEPLQPGTVYLFSLTTERETLSWAFQTKSEWRVESSGPVHAEIGVSAYAALNLYLNQSLTVDITSIEEYFHVSPYIDGQVEQEGVCLRFVPAQSWAEGTVYTVRLDAGLPAVGSDITLAEDYTVAFETASKSSVDKQWLIKGMNQIFKPGQAPVFICVWPELPPEPPQISAALYQYADAAAYAYDLLTWQERAPVWSLSYNYSQGADTAGLTWLGNQELYAQPGAENVFGFSWINALQPGYYLLQASYQGQTRDVRFQVSGLSAFVQATPGGVLLWAHDAASGLPLPEYTASLAGGEQRTQANTDGLALLNVERQPDTPYVLLLEQGGRSLVLSGYAAQSLAEDSLDMWQYLRLSRQTYQSGDSVDFWGYMRRRGGSDWEWSRVTVYICPVDAPDQPVLQGYAPLNNNIFSGSVELPRLLAGVYELQIWQSGQQLLSKEFMVDATVIGASDGPTSIFTGNGGYEKSGLPLGSDKKAYALNESYTIDWPEAGESSGGYLFVKSRSEIQEAVVEDEALHQDLFTLVDAGGAFWQAVNYVGGQYQVSAPLNLPLDSSVCSLNVQLETRNRAANGQIVIGITVRDAAGAAPAKAGALALVAPPGLDMGDILAEIYAPRQGGAVPWQQGFSGGSYGDTPFFAALELDKNGQAELTVPALPPGAWRLYVWVVADAALPLAGQADITLPDGGDSPTPDKPNLPSQSSAVEAAPVFWATRYDISTGSSHFIRKGLLYFSSQERVQAMELLWQPLFSESITAEQCLGQAYARMLWQRYGYDDLALPLADAFGCGVFQQPDGGIASVKDGASDLFLSMRAAALARGGLAEIFDTAALARYLREQAGGGAAAERRAMAMAGLMALGQPVLQEIKLMLAQPGQTPVSRAALIWGLAESGDTQEAKAVFHDFWGAYATDATSGSAYLEGGQGQNVELNRMGALAAAALGEARTTFALLQYLHGQQEYDDLTTALICGGLLSSLYANPASASLTYFLAPASGESSAKDGRAFVVEIGAFNDAWQEYMLPGNLLVDTAQGDIAMTCLRLE